MAISKLLIVSMLASLLFLGARGDAGAKEVEHLRSKFSSLVSRILDRVRELKNKDETVAPLENIIEEKSIQDFAATHWNERAKPALNAFRQKAYEKASQAQKWIEPHVETAKTKWIPVAKEQRIISVRYMEPCVLTVFTKVTEFYEASKSAIAPHIAKAQELADPRFQILKTNDEQKQRIQKTEGALKVAEEELMSDQLEATTNVKEPTEEELTRAQLEGISKVKEILKTNDKQKQRIQKTEGALKVAEEELMSAQLEATSNVKELTEEELMMAQLEGTSKVKEVHGAWLPPWFATHINYRQDFAAIHWNERAKPALNAFLQKAYEKASQAQKWIEPQVETAKTKWIPGSKEQRTISVRYMEPHVRTVFTKLNEFYEASKSAIAPHIAKSQELADPRLQEELMSAQLEATSNVKELTEDFAATHWNERAKPALNAFLQKAYGKASQAQKWIVSVRYMEPPVRTVFAKVIEFYEASKSAIAPHIAKAQEVADPRFQDELMSDQLEATSNVKEPTEEELMRVQLEATSKEELMRALLEATSKVKELTEAQATLMEKLKKHKLTEPLATKELVWFMASALLAIRIFCLYRVYRLLSAIFW